jgi:hypothetical protein
MPIFAIHLKMKNANDPVEDGLKDIATCYSTLKGSEGRVCTLTHSSRNEWRKNVSCACKAPNRAGFGVGSESWGRVYCRVARISLAALTILASAASVSGQARVFRPQSGLTQRFSGGTTSAAFFSRRVISSVEGTRGLWIS